MATAAVTVRMSVEEYLRTSFEPDADYVDGVIEERNVGEWDHAGLQGLLYALMLVKEEEWGVFVSVELRIRITESLCRVPDVCVTDARLDFEQVPTRPPLLCIEVLSPEDRLTEMLRRVKDFHRMGVSQVWVFDPKMRRVWVSKMNGATEWSGGVLQVPGTKIELDPNVAFERLLRRRK